MQSFKINIDYILYFINYFLFFLLNDTKHVVKMLSLITTLKLWCDSNFSLQNKKKMFLKSL